MALSAPLSRAVFRHQATSPGLVTVPNTLTVLSTRDTYVYQIFINNKSGAAQTLLVTDGNAIELISTNINVPTGQTLWEFEGGIYCRNGLKWQAGSANALVGEIVAYVHG